MTNYILARVRQLLLFIQARIRGISLNTYSNGTKGKVSQKSHFRAKSPFLPQINGYICDYYFYSINMKSLITIKLNHHFRWLFSNCKFGVLIMSLILTSSKLLGQSVVFNNSGTFTANGFLYSYPVYPTTTGIGTGLRVGFGYPLYPVKLAAYGGGIRNSFHSDGMGSPWMKWQEQNFRSLSLGSWGSTALGYTYNPGVRYLANRHNWAGYGATFGLKERITNQALISGEVFYTQIVENDQPKDAVITMEYPNSTEASKRPNLVFESIALDTFSSITGNGDEITQLATMTNTGNLGFRSTNPEARIEIKGNSGTTSNKALSIINDNGTENLTIKNNSTGVFLGINNTNPLNNLDIVGSELITGSSTITGTSTIAGSSIVRDNTSPGSNTQFFSLQDANNMSLFKAKGFKLYMEQFKDNSNNRVPLLVNMNTGEIFIDPSLNNPNDLSYWSVGGNNNTNSFLRFGTNQNTDILLWAGGQQYGKVNGYNTTKKGFVELNTSVGIGGDLNGSYPTTDATVALHIIARDNVRKWINSIEPSSIIKCESQSVNPNTTLNYNTFRVLNTGHTYIGDGNGNPNPQAFVTLGRANVDPTASTLNGIPSYSLASVDDNGNYLFRFSYAGPRLILGNNSNNDLDASLHVFTWDGNIVPYTDATRDLGSSVHGWANVYSYNYPTMSDSRLKENIKDIPTGINIIEKLRPVNYYWKSKSIDNDLHYGFIAQELKEVFPNAIVDGDPNKDTLAVRYTELIPILTKAIQEQQKIIENQGKEIEKLNSVFNSNSVGELKGMNHEKNEMNKTPLLFQNHPNPFGSTTLIDYFIPEGSTQAAITVSDVTGKLLYSFIINQFGIGRVELKDEAIAQGDYFYSLTVNGKIIDTKTFQVIKN